VNCTPFAVALGCHRIRVPPRTEADHVNVPSEARWKCGIARDLPVLVTAAKGVPVAEVTRLTSVTQSDAFPFPFL